MAKFCVKCGEALPPRAIFCGSCGLSLDDPAFAPYRAGALTDAAPAEKSRTGLIIAIAAAAVVVIALVAAVPIVLGARARANDRIAQASLRNTLTAAKAIWTPHSDYRIATPPNLQRADASETFIGPNDDSTNATTVSTGSSGPSKFYAAVKSRSGACWYVRDLVSSGGTQWSHARGLSTCRASIVPIAPWTLEPGTGL